MSIPRFSLVKKLPLDIVREGQGRYVRGEWVEGEKGIVTIQANVQPFSDYQTMMLPEADRSKSWLWVFTASELRIKKEGADAHGPDRFQWECEWYECIKVARYKMGILDHVECKAARIELTPNPVTPM